MTDQQKIHWLDYLRAKEEARIAQEKVVMLEKDYIARYREFENFDTIKSKTHGGISKISRATISHNGEIGYYVSSSGDTYHDFYVTTDSIELYKDAS